MNGEERRRQPGSGDIQPLQHAPQQDGTECVHEHVDQVVTHRVGTPQPPFNPQHGRGHGVVVHRLGGEPESIQTVCPVDEGIIYCKAAIVPDETSVPNRQVGNDRGAHQQQGE